MKKRKLLPWAIATCVFLTPAAMMAQSAPVLPGGGIESYGSRGGEVAILQADLAALKHSPGPLDGAFGPLTLAAVKALQSQARIAVDGVVGPITWNAIHRMLSNDYHLTSGSLAATGADFGDVGAPVVELQQDLTKDGLHPGPVNGVYLNDTAGAVQTFERVHGLPVADALTGATLAALTGSSGGSTQSTSAGTSGSTSGGTTGGTTGGTSGSTGSSTGKTIDGHAVVGQINLTATAYGPSLKDNYPYGPVDYYGNPLVAGDVAVDPSVIPLGTLLWVTGYSSPNLPSGGFLARAVDTGGAIKGDRLDIYINQSDAIVSNFGIQQVQAYILGQ